MKIISLSGMCIYCEAPVTYRKDVALKDAWYGEVGTVGHYGIKTSSITFEVVALEIRQYALKNCL